jgi:hypothetical protein
VFATDHRPHARPPACRTQCKPESRLELAVEWNRVDVVQRVMHDGGELNTRDAVQCAIKNQRVEIIKMLLAQVALTT